MHTDIDVIVLSGGFGTRLRSLSPGRQKTVAPIGANTVLGYVLDLVERIGISRVVLALGYRADDVVTFLGSRTCRGTDYLFSIEPEPLGTAGAIRYALPLVRSSNVLVLNGDSFVGINLNCLLSYHHEKRARISMLSVKMKDTSRYGRVMIDPDGSVRSFYEKNERAIGVGWINAGIYVFEREVITAIPAAQQVSLEHDILPKYCADGLYALKTQAPFIDVGTPESFQAAEAFFKQYDLDTR
ncbi:MAG: sugar phosphate nucleotidyltransferase [Alphaproteobacteria bacterium]